MVLEAASVHTQYLHNSFPHIIFFCHPGVVAPYNAMGLTLKGEQFRYGVRMFESFRFNESDVEWNRLCKLWKIVVGVVGKMKSDRFSTLYLYLWNERLKDLVACVEETRQQAWVVENRCLQQYHFRITKSSQLWNIMQRTCPLTVHVWKIVAWKILNIGGRSCQEYSKSLSATCPSAVNPISIVKT